MIKSDYQILITAVLEDTITNLSDIARIFYRTQQTNDRDDQSWAFSIRSGHRFRKFVNTS